MPKFTTATKITRSIGREKNENSYNLTGKINFYIILVMYNCYTELVIIATEDAETCL